MITEDGARKVGKRTREKKGNRTRPAVVSILSGLLFLEAVEFFLLGVFHFNLNKGPSLLNQFFAQWLSGERPVDVDSLRQFVQQLVQNATNRSLAIALVESAVLFLVTILALWAVVGMLRWWRIAWMQAMFVQGACLLIGLILYFLGKPNHIFLLMGTGVFMVLYLNFANKQSIFLSPDDPAPTGKE